MALDFQEGVENAMRVKAFADKAIAFGKSLQRAEGDPPVKISDVTDGLAVLIKEAGALAEQIQVDVKD